jgi:eukaryotic-like serine/threonine-protein kinase
MAILPGKRLGPYEILAAIGAGGMGEVYRARDTRLQRDVALKVLPEIFAADAARMARFEREARLLASLNHPHIAAVYGVEESDSCRALVMELVEGPTLADRIAAGPIPLQETLPIAKQVAEAVEYAHDHGVIHRDLKPANIKVTADGTAKVLDFGLAKALTDEPTETDLRNSPTLSAVATMQGVILGTAAYMSPEQAKGKPVDRRADIWAFGVVLVEMLTGKPLYTGETPAETLASVMMKDPSLGALPANTPPAMRNLIQRCLNKDPRQRLRDIGEARIILADALSGAAPAEPVPAQSKSRERLAWSVAAVLLVGVLALGAFAYFRRAVENTRTTRFFVSPPESWSLALASELGGAATGSLAVSPDGQRVAFVAKSADGRSLLWVRPLDTLTAQALAGTDAAAPSPFWSPDSRFLGFFAGGKLKKIEVSGGPPITLCDAPNNFGGAWSRDGLILFSTGNAALQKVSAAGGVPTAATVLGQGEFWHGRPSFLPDSRHFLYRAGIGGGGRPIYAASLDSAERKLLFNADSANVIYSQGHLLFLRETTLMAQPFDARRLELAGDPFPIAEQILTQIPVAPYGVFSASDNGVLAYQTGTSMFGSHLVWLDRAGKQIGVLGDSAAYSDLELSPDGKRVAVSIQVQAGKGRDIWLYDVARGLRTRFTFGPAAAVTSTWSPDGSRIVFTANPKGHLDLYQKSASGAGTEEVLLSDGLEKYAYSWSPDGRFILYNSGAGTPRTAGDIWVLPLSGDRKPFPFLQTQFNEVEGRFSPDNRWVAYFSNESGGKSEVYVAPFPGPGGKWQISTAGGNSPRWRRDGAEIFYLDPDNKLMAAAVNGKGASFVVGAVKPLFQTRPAPGLRYQYDVSADGQRFLINTAPEQSASTPITVVVNWAAGLKK